MNSLEHVRDIVHHVRNTLWGFSKPASLTALVLNIVPRADLLPCHQANLMVVGCRLHLETLKIMKCILLLTQ